MLQEEKLQVLFLQVQVCIRPQLALPADEETAGQKMEMAWDSFTIAPVKCTSRRVLTKADVFAHRHSGF